MILVLQIGRCNSNLINYYYTHTQFGDYSEEPTTERLVFQLLKDMVLKYAHWTLRVHCGVRGRTLRTAMRSDKLSLI